MTYTRMTIEERSQIYALRQAGKGNNEIARILGRDKSTISREVKRNTGQRGYRYQQAHRMATERAKRPGRRRFTEEVQADVVAGLQEGWTPEAICSRAKLEGRAHVCKETVYKFIYEDSKSGGELWKSLPRSRRKRRKRIPRQSDRGRGKIPGRRDISERPPEVEYRILVGDWEGDLIQGAPGTGYLVTLVERTTRFTLVGCVNTKEATEVAAEVIRLLGSIGIACTSITFDNGKEFACHADISDALKIDVYFARPYHSWERGTNENTNGLIRRLYPKGSSFADIGTVELQRIDRFLNDRPKKCLGWHTPREVMQAFLVTAA